MDARNTFYGGRRFDDRVEMENPIAETIGLQVCTSYILTRLCYRELAVVEDRHQAHKDADLDYYNCVEEECAVVLRQTIAEIKEVQQSGGILEKLISPIKGNRFNKFFRENVFCCGDWDHPVLLSIALPTPTAEQCAAFVLGGTFLKACREGWNLTDSEMKRINIDVHNRFYSLMNAGIIPVPTKESGRPVIPARKAV